MGNSNIALLVTGKAETIWKSFMLDWADDERWAAEAATLSHVCEDKVMGGFSDSGSWEVALCLLSRMIGDTLQPTAVNYNTAIRACEQGAQLGKNNLLSEIQEWNNQISQRLERSAFRG